MRGEQRLRPNSRILLDHITNLKHLRPYLKLILGLRGAELYIQGTAWTCSWAMHLSTNSFNRWYPLMVKFRLGRGVVPESEKQLRRIFKKEENNRQEGEHISCPL